MIRMLRTVAALALFAAAQGCSDEDDVRPVPPSTCTPTPQGGAEPADVQQFCVDYYAALCDRSFTDCAGLGAGDYYPDAATCRADMAALCATIDFSNASYDDSCGQVCIGFIRAAECSVLVNGDEPQACAAAIGNVSPPPPPPELVPEVVATIAAGTIQDTITVADPVYQLGHARAYAIHLTAGQAVLIETSPPTSGIAIYDTVVHLLDPSLAQIGVNDDGSTTPLYSRLQLTPATTGYHRIVVRGYSTSRVGSYRLSVTTY